MSGSGLGIDLGALGQLSNDSGDNDAGPNRGQNWPVIGDSLANANGTRQITVALNSTVTTSYRIDVYRSPDCPGGNRGGNLTTRIGTYLATTSALGLGIVDATVSGSGAPGFLTATATNAANGDTSEISIYLQEPVNATLFSSSFE